jgi:hypothetical protein
MPDGMCCFKSIGFIEVGCWNPPAENLTFRLDDLADARDTLYAFLVAGEVMYIGETGTPLRERLGCYKRGNQSTNGRIKVLIQESLKQDKDVEILVLSPESPLLRTGECQLSLAAGVMGSGNGDAQLPRIVVPLDRYLLEDILVLYLTPAWNIGARNKSSKRRRRKLR